ncbi:Histidine kinase [Cyclobacterium xiamenense]|uniref:Histidine kinase n=1 Tax=Cyclobacterium xiamenense TaxID=1297121 RepID=A0A1H7AU52_9BACT|nr:histidine kinase [Cyclobacterium xiamenense]SEJ68164.1 Histidine kinase [Cyclobacterium xiamenense]
MDNQLKIHKLTGEPLDHLAFLLLVFTGMLACSFFWHQQWEWAIQDAITSTLAFGLGVFLLNLMLYYYPSGKFKTWPALMFSLVISIGLVFCCRLLWKSALLGNPEFLALFEASLPFRVIVGLLLFHLSGLIILSGKTSVNEFQQMQRGELRQKLSADAELHYLRQQMQPHFLFNSLNSINALLARQPEKAREMVQGLADFYRENLNKDPRKWESLTREMNVIGQYLELEKIRFGQRLAYELVVPSDADALKLPSLLIQTLVENAVKHGLYGMTGDILIRIEAKKEGQLLSVTVENPTDNPLGTAAGTGFGLESLERRLFLIFGRKDLLLIRNTEGVFSATIKIPQTG